MPHDTLRRFSNVIIMDHRFDDEKMLKQVLATQITPHEFWVWAALGAMNDGLPKEEACAKYGLTVEEWEQEYQTIMEDFAPEEC